jgi:hypothetical protein
MSGAHTAWPAEPSTAPQPAEFWPDAWLTPEDRKALRAEQIQRIHARQDARQAGQTWPLDTPPRIDLQRIKRKQGTFTRTVARLAALVVLAVTVLTVIRYLIIVFVA